MVVFTIFGDQSYSELKTLQSSLARQNRDNSELKEYISDLKQRIFKLENDNRTLEKVARSELALGKDNEFLFIFDR